MLTKSFRNFVYWLLVGLIVFVLAYFSTIGVSHDCAQHTRTERGESISKRWRTWKTSLETNQAKNNQLKLTETIFTLNVAPDKADNVPESTNSGYKQNVEQEDSVKVKVNKEWKTSEATFIIRRRRLTKVCHDEPEVTVGQILSVREHKGSGVIWGFAPNSGSTFWNHVFNVVNKVPHLNGDVFSTTKVENHQLLSKETRYDPSAHAPEMFPTRIVVARDPFSRLLSAWLDKAYLPDFWANWMLPMVKRRTKTEPTQKDFLRQHFDDLAGQFDKGFTNRTWAEQRCGKYLTFSNFITDILNSQRQEPHWMPLAQMCNPCTFKATHIVHMETFIEDARPLLDKLGLPDFLNQSSRNQEVEDNIRIILGLNFWKLRNDYHWKNCTTAHELAYRLWNYFQWVGYIHPETSYLPPPDVDPALVQKDMKRQLVLARAMALKETSKTVAAKKDFFKKVYSTITPNIFGKLLLRFRHDFQLYGHENVNEVSKLILF